MLIETSFSKIESKEILNTGLFDFEEAEQAAGWIEELNKAEHTPETDEYGIGSFVYRSSKPFNSERFRDYIQNKFPSNVIRSKGLFWLDSRPAQAISWSQAGDSLKADNAGVWWSSMPYEKRIQYVAFVDNQEHIESTWDTYFGDRKNELVFIGQDMNEKLIRRELDNCLLTDKEIRSEKWKQGYEDSWPVQRAFALD